MSKKIEILIIEDDVEVIHRSVSTVYADSNPYNVAIQAMVEQLTGVAPRNAVQRGAIPLTKSTDKFAEATFQNETNQLTTSEKFQRAVPNYVPPPEPKVEPFHPDLVKEGVAPKVEKAVENGIPTVKLKMSDVFKGKQNG